MKPAACPPDEEGRIATLHALNLLDTPAEERFDRLTRIARRLFSVPIAQVSLIDANRQWIKSSSGAAACESARDIAFCAHALLNDDILQVENALHDERFSDNPLVVGDPKIRFYAGCPLRVGDHKMGTLCLIDQKPRSFTEDERALLRDLAAIAEENLAAERIAVTDELTELANRRGFEIFAQKMLGICNRLTKPATLVYFDLNDFKEINDTFGHPEGDRTLQLFAECLRGAFRDSDIVARLGGDEFAALLTDTTQETAIVALDRLRAAVNEENRRLQPRCEIRFSAGSTEFDSSRHESIESLLAEADAAMYADKMRSR